MTYEEFTVEELDKLPWPKVGEMWGLKCLRSDDDDVVMAMIWKVDSLPPDLRYGERKRIGVLLNDEQFVWAFTKKEWHQRYELSRPSSANEK